MRFVAIAGPERSGNPMASVYPTSDTGAVLWSKGKRIAILPLLGHARGQPQPLAPVSPNRPTLRRGGKGSAVAIWQAAIGRDGGRDPHTAASAG